MTIDPRVQVAVGILHKHDGSLLIGQRRAGTDCAGKWEFPGGKVEKAETPEMALARELKEELGVEISQTQPLIQLDHDYPHAHVRLHCFMVHEWLGEVRAAEGQQLAWEKADKIAGYDLLEAAFPLLKAARKAL